MYSKTVSFLFSPGSGSWLRGGQEGRRPLLFINSFICRSCERCELLVGLLVGRRDQFKPLPERVAQRLWQGVDVTQDDVEGEGELVHVGADLRQLPRSFKDGHLDVQDGVLRHRATGLRHTFSSGKHTITSQHNITLLFFTYP